MCVWQPDPPWRRSAPRRAARAAPQGRAKRGELRYLESAQAYFDDDAHFQEISRMCSFTHRRVWQDDPGARRLPMAPCRRSTGCRLCCSSFLVRPGCRRRAACLLRLSWQATANHTATRFVDSPVVLQTRRTRRLPRSRRSRRTCSSSTSCSSATFAWRAARWGGGLFPCGGAHRGRAGAGAVQQDRQD